MALVHQENMNVHSKEVIYGNSQSFQSMGCWSAGGFCAEVWGTLRQHPNTFGRLDSKAVLLEPRVAQNISGMHLSVSFMTFLSKVSKPVQRTLGESKHCFTLIHLLLLAHLLTKMFIS